MPGCCTNVPQPHRDFPCPSLRGIFIRFSYEKRKTRDTSCPRVVANLQQPQFYAILSEKRTSGALPNPVRDRCYPFQTILSACIIKVFVYDPLFYTQYFSYPSFFAWMIFLSMTKCTDESLPYGDCIPVSFINAILFHERRLCGICMKKIISSTHYICC